jgi:hypothetical protein
MKLKLYALALLAPMQLLAQPTINKAENYSIGTKYTFYNCNTAGFNPGSAGTNEHWMFDDLKMTDSTVYSIVAPASTPNGSKYPTATYAVKNEDTFTYYNSTATGTYLLGFSETGMSYEYTNSALYVLRPLTYNTTIKDTFKENFSQSFGSGVGGGTVTLKADAYGMLHLPNGVFNDVIRVRIDVVQTDSFEINIPPAPPQKIKSTLMATKYAWYDNIHYAPLLAWDSTVVTIAGGPGGGPQTTKSVSYLAHEDYPTSVNDVKAAKKSFAAAIQNNTLRLNGNFNTGSKYNVTVMNMAGQRIAEYNTVAQDKNMNLELNSVAAGMYLISVYEYNKNGVPEIIKVEKQ